MAGAPPAEIVHADAGAPLFDHLVQLGAPVVGGGGVVDVVQGAAGDLAAVDVVQAGAGQTQTVVPRLADHVDQADGRQVPFEMIGLNRRPPRQAPALTARRPIGEHLLMRPHGAYWRPDLHRPSGFRFKPLESR